MSERTKISWTDSTLNFWSGCTKVSPGCAHCYAEELAGRFITFGRWDGGPHKLHESAFKLAQKLNRKPWVTEPAPDGVVCADGMVSRRREIFSLSLGDWLDPEVPVEWLARMLDTIRRCDQVRWLLLTKRPELWGQRLEEVVAKLEESVSGGPLYNWLVRWLSAIPPQHVAIGTSVEDQQRADERIPALLRIPAYRRFLSIEPLLSQIDLSQWFCENQRNDVYGAGCPEMVLGGQAGEDLEGQQANRRESATNPIVCPEPATQPRREKPVTQRGILESDVYLPAATDVSLRTPHSVDDSERVGHSITNGDQPQGRQQAEQQTLQLGTGNAVPECNSLLPGVGKEIKTTGRGNEQFIETEQRASENNPQPARATDSNRDCIHVQGESKDRFGNTTAENVGISWVIIGGESGQKARPCNVEWIRSLVKQGQEAGARTFVKQTGSLTIRSSKEVKTLPNGLLGFHHHIPTVHPKGGDPSEWPEDLRIQQRLVWS